MNTENPTTDPVDRAEAARLLAEAEGRPPVSTAHDVRVFAGFAAADVVYDEQGQHNASSTAEHLAKRGCLVEIATHDRMVGEEIGTTNQPIHLRELYKLGVVMSPNMELIEIYPEGNRLVAALRNTYTDAEEERVVDRVVVDYGSLPVDQLYFGLKAKSRNHGQTDQEALVAGRAQPGDGEGFALYRIGDAVAGRNIHAAIYDALRLCKDI